MFFCTNNKLHTRTHTLTHKTVQLLLIIIDENIFEHQNIRISLEKKTLSIRRKRVKYSTKHLHSNLQEIYVPQINSNEIFLVGICLCISKKKND